MVLGLAIGLDIAIGLAIDLTVGLAIVLTIGLAMEHQATCPEWPI